MGIFSPNIDKLKKNNDTQKLVQLLSNKKAEIRLSAFLALSDTRDDNIIQSLKKLLNDPDPKIKTMVTFKYGDVNGDDILINLKSIIGGGKLSDKITALKLLSTGDVKKLPQISTLIQYALNDKNTFVKETAIRAAVALKDTHSVDMIIATLQNQHSQVRYEAAKALGELMDQKAVNYLIMLLIDHVIEVQNAAKMALTKLGRQDILNDVEFMQLSQNMGESEKTKLDTIAKISRQKIVKAIPLLIKACTDEFKLVRLEAAKAIGHIEDKSGIDGLKMLLDDKFFDARLEAVKALAHLLKSNDEEIELLEKAKKDVNKNVRDEAERTLNSIKKK